MTAGTRIFLLAAAVVVLTALVVFRQSHNEAPSGMTEQPCAANGGPATGNAKDDWARLCAYRAANAELIESSSRPEVVMIGDSITAHWPAIDRSIVDRGIAGQSSAQVLLRFRQDAVALRPRIVHILVGINDIAGLGGQVSPDMYANNIRAMVELAEAQGIAVIIGTIPPARRFDWAPDADPGRWVPILNAWLERYAGEKNLILADYNAVLTDNRGRIAEGLFRDGVHPNASGYAAMTRVFEQAVEQARSKHAKLDLLPPRSVL